MVKTSGPHGCNITETALHLVGRRQGGQEVSPATIGVLSSGQYGAQVVTRMTGFALGQVTIVEVEVAHQRAIMERGAIRGCLPASDQGTVFAAAKILNLRSNHPNRLSGERTQSAAECIQHPDLELLTRCLRKVFVSCARDKLS
jgi:hypothetical protein